MSLEGYQSLLLCEFSPLNGMPRERLHLASSGTLTSRMQKIGTILRPEMIPDAGLFGTNQGEDWVVPKDSAHYLIVQELAQGALLTAFDTLGRLVAERYSPSYSQLSEQLSQAVAMGAAYPPLPIPDGAQSVLSWLDQAPFGSGP